LGMNQALPTPRCTRAIRARIDAPISPSLLVDRVIRAYGDAAFGHHAPVPRRGGIGVMVRLMLARLSAFAGQALDVGGEAAVCEPERSTVTV
jgi:hypothetical protein